MYLWSNSLTLLLCAGLNGSGDTTPTESHTRDSNPPIVGPIIGGVVGGLVLIVVIAIILLIVVFFLMRKNKRKLL